MGKPLPILISIPHGGNIIPKSVQDCVALTNADILEDGDAFTRKIYNFGQRVRMVIHTDVARAIVDVNRDASQLPPVNPDGVVKTVTCYNKPVYQEGCFPNHDLVDKLIRDFYTPYHNRIQCALEDDGIVMGFDCHSMAGQAPPIELRCGQQRPIVNIGNVYGNSCPMNWAVELADCLRDVFGLEDADVTLNEPFAGGFITRTYGGNPIPWMQIEISRDLYLKEPWFNKVDWTVSEQRLDELNNLIWRAINKFYWKITR